MQVLRKWAGMVVTGWLLFLLGSPAGAVPQ
jgi:hypothetical protein